MGPIILFDGLNFTWYEQFVSVSFPHSPNQKINFMESRSLSSQTVRAKLPTQSLPRAFNGSNPKSLFSLPSSPSHISPMMPLLTSSRRLEIHRRSTSFTRQTSNSSSKFRASAVGSDSGRQLDVTRELIILNSALTLVLGVGNRVLYKLALVPMKEYPFFLAQLTTFGWVLVFLFQLLYDPRSLMFTWMIWIFCTSKLKVVLGN